MLGKLIECVEMDIGEKLAGEIADWQAKSFRRMQQTFMSRHPVEQGRGRTQNRGGARIVQNDLPDQTAQPFFLHPRLDLRQYCMTIDAGEKIGDIRFRHKSRARPVARHRPRKSRNAAASVVAAPPRNAGVAVADETAVKTIPYRVENQVMHNTIPKTGRPDFAGFRMRYHEGKTAANLIAAVLQIAPQGHQVSFQIGLEGKLMQSVALVTAAIEIGVAQRLKGQFRRRHGEDRGGDFISWRGART